MGRKRTGYTRNPEMGARARAQRERLGLSKISVASALDLGTGRLSQMERDGVEGLSLITQWAKALQLTPADLAFGTPELDRAAGLTPTKKAKRA